MQPGLSGSDLDLIKSVSCGTTVFSSANQALRFSRQCQRTKMRSSTRAPLANLKCGPLALRALPGLRAMQPPSSLGPWTRGPDDENVWKTGPPSRAVEIERTREPNREVSPLGQQLSTTRGHPYSTPHETSPGRGLSCSAPAVDPRPRIDQDQVAGVIGQATRPPSFISRAKV